MVYQYYNCYFAKYRTAFYFVILIIIFFIDTRQLESHMEALRQKQAETRDPMVSELRKLTDSFQTSAEQMKSHVIAAINSQLQTQVQNAMSG